MSSTGDEPSYQYDAADGENSDLYGRPHQPGEKPDREYLDKWLGMVNEVVEKYQPELIWFDFGLGKVIDPTYQQRMFADYYNWAEQQGLQVGVAHKHWDIHEHTGIIDFERGRMDKSTKFPWLTDTSVGPWFHQKSHEYKSVDDLVDVTVDIVSKNGCMLLNVGPAADGSIPPEAQELLRGLGAWMEVNGEAIYATRPWLIYGEGPTRMKKSGGFSERDELKYTHQDIRFTRSKDGKIVYAIVLGWPDSPLTIRSIKVCGDGCVQLLGGDQRLNHRVDGGGRLVIDLPKKQFGLHAHALKLTGFELSLSNEALFRKGDSIHVPPEKVTLEGSRVRLQDVGGRPNIGAWDKADERAHWLVFVPQAGLYALQGEFSSAYGSSKVTTTLAGQSHTTTIPPTKGWFKQALVRLGQYKFDRPGVYQLTLSPTDAAEWKAVNVWNLALAPID